MAHASNASDRNAVRVGVADYAVTADGRPLATSGLGSCVAVALYDTSGSGVGGLLHAMLPTSPDEVENAAKYVDTGVDAMLDEIAAAGGDPTAVVAKYAGGSAMLNIGSGDGIGAKNVDETERVLADIGVDVDGSDTGGGSGRSVRFMPTDGTFTVERVGDDTLTL